MTDDEIDQLKAAILEAMAAGAPPESMQPINDFINRVAAGGGAETTGEAAKPTA